MATCVGILLCSGGVPFISGGGREVRLVMTWWEFDCLDPLAP